MKNLFTYLLLLFFSLKCLSQSKADNSFYEEDKTINLFAFVGKKISIIELNGDSERVEKIIVDPITGEKIVQKSYSLDHGFKCKYLISKKVFNNLQRDTIDFVAYDHYGRPNFENYETVLLYISRSEDGKYFYSRKYQFDPLFKDKNGQLFGSFTFLIPEDLAINSKLKHFKIDFENSIVYNVKEYNEYMLKTYLPEPFYKIKNGEARPFIGARIKDLFLSKKTDTFPGVI